MDRTGVLLPHGDSAARVAAATVAALRLAALARGHSRNLGVCNLGARSGSRSRLGRARGHDSKGSRVPVRTEGKQGLSVGGTGDVPARGVRRTPAGIGLRAPHAATELLGEVG